MSSPLLEPAERLAPAPRGLAPKRSRHRRIAVAAGLLAVALGAAAMLLFRAKPPAAAPVGSVLTVSVVPVEHVRLADALLVNGSLSPWEDLSIGSEAAGLAITRIEVEEGDWVRAGQPLAKLDDALLQAQLRQADAQIARSEAMLRIGDSDVRRAEELLKTSAISIQAAEQRQATAQAARADLALAQAQRAALVAQIDRTEIRAPADGYISKRTARLGRVVNTGDELFREVRDGILELDAEVPDRLLARCRAGQTVRIKGADDGELTGRVRAVAPLVDTTSRNGIVHVRFPRSDRLRPGMFVTAELILGELETLAVPENAVLVKDGRPLVFLLAAGSHAALRPVETGPRIDGKVAIRTGLSEGEQVVTAGAGFLRDGDLVRVAELPQGPGGS